MNRIESLSSSLQSWVDAHRTLTDFVVVDWSSSRPIYENSTVRRLLEEKKIKVVRVEGEKYFSLPRSYNLAARHSSTTNKIILKLDADYVLKDARWLDHIHNQITGAEGISSNEKLSGYYITGSHMFSLSYTGFVLLNKENFVQYNENMEGYGHDDIEMYERMKTMFPELREIIFFNIKDYIHHIPHSDDDRGTNYENKNIKETSLKNMDVDKNFTTAKYKVLSEEGNITVVKRVV